MDPFVRRLVQRLHAPNRPLSRNRHFHAFQSPEGKAALRISRRLRSLQRDIEACAKQGRRPSLTRRPEGDQLVELRFDWVRGCRVAILSGAELELLRELPGMDQALGP